MTFSIDGSGGQGIDLSGPDIAVTNPDGTLWDGSGSMPAGSFGNVGLSPATGAATAAVDGRSDKPTPLSRWYATVDSLVTGAAVVELDDDSQGRSTITVPYEVAPVAGDRVIVDFRPDGMVAITAVVS